MITGIGLDIVEVERISSIWQKYGRRFAEHFLNDYELELMPKNNSCWLAGRFAAKEAASKALGTGIARGVGWHNLIIYNNQYGKPVLRFTGAALAISNSLGVTAAFLSISHEKHFACAQVILEAG